MEKKKVFISSLLMLLMVFLMLPFVNLEAYAAVDDTFKTPVSVIDESVESKVDMTFKVLSEPSGGENGTVQVGDGENSAIDDNTRGKITIPDEVTYNDKTYKVTSISASAFFYCTGLTSVSIGDSVTTIGDFAFAYCENLEKFVVSQDNGYFSTAEDGVLFNKNKTELVQYPIGKTETTYTIPDSVTSIGDFAFSDCTWLTSVSIGDSVTSIGDEAFAYCTGLESIEIPDGVTTIGDYAFVYCENLEKFVVSQDNGYFSTAGDGVLFDKNKTELVQYPIGKTETTYTIPDSVTSIGDFAFSDCTWLTSVSIGDSVTSIGDEAFSYCTGLESIEIPDGVTTIGDYAFSDCIWLTSVSIGDSVTSIGDYAFSHCTGLTSVSIGDSVTSIGDFAFSYCTGLESIEIPDGVTTIGDFTFSDCTGLISVSIGDSVTTIGDSAFYGCTGLTSVSIPDSVTTIGDEAFSHCTKLTSVTIPDSVTTIGDFMFSDCTGLTSVSIGDSVTTIGDEAFSHCTKLTSVTIPDSVTTIGDSAFYGCASLKSVYFDGDYPNIGNNAIDKNVAIYYNSDAQGWDEKGATSITIAVELEDNLVYNAIEQTQNVTVTVNGKILAPDRFTLNGHMQTDAGDYVLTVTLDEYNSLIILKKFTIAKAEQSEFTVTSTATTYGTDLTLVTSGGKGEGDISYLVVNGTGSATISDGILTPTKAGTVVVTAKKAGDSNYNDITSEPTTITIEKANYVQKTTADGSAKYGKTGEVDLSVWGALDGVSFGDISNIEDNFEILVPNTLKIIDNRLEFKFVDDSEKQKEFAQITIPVTATNYKDFEIIVTVFSTYYDIPIVRTNPIVTTYSGSPTTSSAITGTAYVDGVKVDGVFSFEGKQKLTDVADSGIKSVKFTPTDDVNYSHTFTTVNLTINKATPTGTPTFATINESGKTLADVNLSIGAITPTGGAITWKLDEETIVESNTSYEWTYTPLDGENYTVLTGYVTPYRVSTGSGSSSSDDRIDSGDKTSVEDIQDLIDDGDSLIVEGKNDLEVEFDEKALEAILGDAGDKDIVFIAKEAELDDLSEGQKIVIGDNLVLNLKVLIDGVEFTNFDSGTVTISLPYELDEGQTTSNLKVYYVDDEGNKTLIESSYDEKTGMLTFRTNHFSIYMVTYEDMIFSDVSSDNWFYDDVMYVYTNGLMTGTSSTEFSPNLSATRSMIWTVLARMSGEELEKTDIWYEAGQTWAMENGISDGTNPDGSITREELVTMLYRYEQVINNGGFTGTFAFPLQYDDAESVSDWAWEAMLYMTMKDVINGKTETTLAPKDTATRAEISAIIHRYSEME